MSGLRCWLCEAEPDRVEVTAFGDAEPKHIAARWPTPGVDHEHAVYPPTPAELLDGGDRALARIMEEWTK